MSTFVLVAGAWIGEWAWEQVTDQLENLGHTVYPRSLPGLAERIGESRPKHRHRRLRVGCQVIYRSG